MQLKFTLAVVIAVLAAVTFGYVSFLGKNFSTLGDTQESIIYAVIIAVVLFGTTFTAKLLKGTNRNFKISLFFEVLVLIAFLAFTFLFALKPFSHFIEVTKNKDVIQNNINQSISQAENMFQNYEQYADNRKTKLEDNLKSVVKNREIDPQQYANFGFGLGVSEHKLIQQRVTTMDIDLFPSNYSDQAYNNGIKEVATNWLGDARSKINNWKPIGVVNVVTEIEKNSIDWYNKLVGFSNITHEGEPILDPFNYDLKFQNVTSHFSHPEDPAPVSIVFAAMAGMLMLLPWFITKRGSRRFGGIAKYEIKL
jgi:hypothetical protein